jgi:hypothetical protein
MWTVDDKVRQQPVNKHGNMSSMILHLKKGAHNVAVTRPTLKDPAKVSSASSTGMP